MLNFNRKLLYIITVSSIFLSSCGFNFSSNGNNFFPKTQAVISGVIFPFLGSITNNTSSSLIISSLTAATCSDPVYARLYKIESDGSVSDANPLASELVSPDARYSFKLEKLNISNEDDLVSYIVKATGCNGEVYKRPITDFNSDQDINAKTSIIADVVNANSLVTNKLNSVSRESVQTLINALENTQSSSAIDSLILSVSNSNKFQQIFGSSPNIIQNAVPEVILNTPKTTINELANSVFRIDAFHSDPTYSFAYSWKLDGDFKTASATFNYIPAANDSGDHSIDVYVGKKDSAGKIDLTKPYFTKRIAINVNNNILPTPPALTINSSTPSPRNTNFISINFATGINYTNCASFSRMAVTESATPPGIGQFIINCNVPVTQTETITYGSGEGAKNLYFWAIDNEGVISPPSIVSLLVDTISPVVNFSSPSTVLKGGSIVTLNYSVTDANSISSLNLSYAADGVSFGAPFALSIGSTTTTWNVNSSDVTSAKLKITATDIAGNFSSATTNAFTIDSTPPSAPTLSITSSAITKSSTITLTVGSCADTASILITESNIKPNAETNGWQMCTTGAGITTATINGDGAHTLYAWAKDFAGNIAISTNSVNVILDTTLPVLAVTTPKSMRGNVNTGSLSWTLTEANVAVGAIFNVEIYDGTSWTNVGTKAAIIVPNVGFTYTLSNFSVPAIDSVAAKMRVTFVDAALNSSTILTNAFMIDSSPPVVTALVLNKGGTTTFNSNLTVNLNSISSQGAAKITHFCLKYNLSVTPVVSDTCWTSLTRPDINITPATTINISNYYFPLGFSPGIYSVYGWVKDEVGQISSPLNSNMTLIPATPPTITNIIVSLNDNPSMPLSYEDTSFPLGSNVYINWHIEDKNNELQANSVKLEYTFDEITWISIVPDLSLSNQNGCTKMAGATGCYLWSAGAPSDNGTNENLNDDKTFKIRISAKNINQISTFGTSNNVNSANLKLIAGNTNTGLNGSAISAIFPMITSSEFVSTETFVMTSRGELFFIDPTRGLLYVSPNNGIQTLLIETNDTFGATEIEDENGNISKKTKLKRPYKVGIDYQDNLYIYDYDRIRKINTSVPPMAITTIIGGGTFADIETKPALDLKITPLTFSGAQKYDFHVLGNGDIWFTSEEYKGDQSLGRRRIRFFDHTKTNIYSYNISGIGNSGSALVDLASPTTSLLHFAIAYDPNTFNITKMIASSIAPGLGLGISSIRTDNFTAEAPHPTGNTTGTLSSNGFYDNTYTGLDGNIYFLDYNMTRINKYDVLTNSFSTVYGSNSLGNCPPKTLALDCNVNIGGIFVNKQGKLFVLDGGVIRTIDDTKMVQDVFGQNLSYGEDTLATNARFKQISSLGVWYDTSTFETKVIVNDRYGYKIKEFVVGGNINTIAGNGLKNGSPAKDTGATLTNINSDGVNGGTNNINMLVDSGNGDIYKGVDSSGNYVLKRNIGNWKDVIATVVSPSIKMDSDSLIGPSGSKVFKENAGDVDFGNYSVTSFMGMTSKYLLMIDHDYASSAHRSGAILLYDRELDKLEKIAGKYTLNNTGGTRICDDGTLPTSCDGYHSFQTASTGHTQAFYDSTLDAWILAEVGKKNVRILKKGVNMSTIATLLGNIRSMAYVRIGGASPTTHKIWYCTTGGSLREYNLLEANPTKKDKPLKWTIPNMSCQSRYLNYSPERNSLIFPILQNDLAGVAEYLL